jgi:hypothetical protein
VRDPDACAFGAQVFVRIFLPDGTTLVHESSKVTSNATVDMGRFDLGAAGCPQPQLLGQPALTIDPPSIIAGGAPTTGRLTISITSASVRVDSAPESPHAALRENDIALASERDS